MYIRMYEYINIVLMHLWTSTMSKECLGRLHNFVKRKKEEKKATQNLCCYLKEWAFRFFIYLIKRLLQEQCGAGHCTWEEIIFNVYISSKKGRKKMKKTTQKCKKMTSLLLLKGVGLIKKRGHCKCNVGQSTVF